MTQNRNSGGFFNQSTQPTGDSTATFFAQTTNTDHIAILNSGGSVSFSPAVTAQAIRTLIGAGTSTVSNNGDGTFTVTDHANGTEYTIDPETNLGVATGASTVTITSSEGSDAVIPSATTTTAGVMSSADKMRLDSITPNVGEGTQTLNTLQIDSTVYRVGGGTPAHASLRVGFGVSPSSRQAGLQGNITGTPTAHIDNGDGTTSPVDSISIDSAHSSVRDSTVVIADDRQTFRWAQQGTDAAQTVTFTCAFTVNYTIDGSALVHSFTRTANFTIPAAPVPFYTGTFSQAQFDARETLDDAAVILALTRMDDFTSPFTTEYTGDADNNRYACLYVPGDITIGRVSSEGFVFDTVVSTPTNSNGYRLWIVNAPLSPMTHEVTWRAAS